MAELVRCSQCCAHFFDAPVAGTGLNFVGREIPSGYRPMFHLCSDCSRKFNAKRCDGWTWIAPIDPNPRSKPKTPKAVRS